MRHLVPLVSMCLLSKVHTNQKYIISVTAILLKVLHVPTAPLRGSSFGEIVAKMDLMGMIMLTASLTFLVVGLNLGGQSLPWNSPTVIAMLVAAVITFLLFVIAEKIAELPVAPPKLFMHWRWRNVPIIIGE